MFSAATACVKVGTRSAYLGTTSRADLIKTISLMSNKRGPKAPVQLDAKDLEDDGLENHSERSALKIERNRLKTILKAERRRLQVQRPFIRKNTGSMTGSLAKPAVSGQV